MKKLILYLFYIITLSLFNPQPILAAECSIKAKAKAGKNVYEITVNYGAENANKYFDIDILSSDGHEEDCQNHLQLDDRGSFSYSTTVPFEGDFKIRAQIEEGPSPGCYLAGPKAIFDPSDCEQSFTTAADSTDSTMPATRPVDCPDGSEGIYTAIGCIPTDTADFVNYILARAVSIGGGIAFLLMLFGAFTLITSAGNPENVQKGKDILTSALTGLLFIIFAIFLLKFIGVDILQLPEFEETKITIPSRPTPKRR